MKGLKITFGSLFGLLLVVILLLQFSAVQNYIGQRVTAYFAHQWNTTFTASEVSFSLFSLELDTVYLADQEADTLLAVDNLSLRFNILSLLQNTIDVSNVELSGGTVQIRREEEASGYNFDFLVNYFAGESTTSDTTSSTFEVAPTAVTLNNIAFLLEDRPGGLDWQSQLDHFFVHAEEIDLEHKLISIRDLRFHRPTIRWVQGEGTIPPTPAGDEPLTELEGDALTRLNPGDWTIRVGNMLISEGHFAFREASQPIDPTPGLINFSNLDISGIDFSLSGLLVQKDTLTTRLHHLSLAEHSGFQLDTLNGDVRVAANEIGLENMLLQTEHTRIADEIHLKYRDFSAFSDFVNQVQLYANFSGSDIALKDIDYFAPGIPLANDIYHLDGLITGTVSSLRGKQLRLQYGEVTDLQGDFSSFGLPNINETFIDFTVESFRTNRKEFMHIVPMATLPENTRMLGNIQFDGNFTGFMSDFVAHGRLQTNIGYFESDINMKIPGGADPPTYSGELMARNFQIGKWQNDPLLGTVSFSADVDGSGFDIDRLYASAEGIVHHIDFNNYRYKDLNFDGELKKKFFSGNLNIDDPNLKLDFSGTVDFDSAQPVFNLNADIGFARLKRLNLIEEDYKVRTNLNAQFTGTNLDELLGTIKLKNTEFYTEQRFYPIGEVSLTADQYELGKRLTLNSTLADAMLDGRYNLSELPGTFLGYLSNYYPSILNLPNTTATSADMDFGFSFEIKKSSQLTDLILPQIKSTPGTSINGNFNTRENRLIASVNLPFIEYNGMKAVGTHVFLRADADTLHFEAESENVQITEGLSATHRIDGYVNNNNVFFNLKVYEDSLLDQLFANAILTNSGDSIQLRLLDSRVTLANETWQIDETNELSYYHNKLFASNLEFINGKQIISFTTHQNVDRNTDLGVNLQKVELNHLLDIIGFTDYTVAGAIDGNLSLTDVLVDARKLDVDATVNDFNIEGDGLGTLNINTTYNFQEAFLELRSLLDTEVGSFNINGKATKLDQDPQLDFQVQAEKTPFVLVAPFTKGLLSDLEGTMRGQFSIIGSANDPEVSGRIEIHNGAGRFDYLNTKYYFETVPIIFTKKSIFINETKIHDTKDRTGSRATIGGEIYFDDLSNFTLEDVYVYTEDNFKFMETTREQNDQFYGTAFGKAILQINGPMDNLDIYINASSSPGTVVNIPISYEEGVAQYDFIRFRKPDTVESKTNLEQFTDYGFALTMDLNITRDAVTRLIFNEQTGEVINGRGEGNLKLTLDNNGDFFMYGSYTIVDGDYLFRLQDVISKKFQIDKGGTIKWTGDPYEAMLDLSAVYSRKVSRFDLVSDLSDQLTDGEIRDLKKPVPVDVYLNMSGALTNPDIDFDIRVDDNDQSLVNVFQNRLRELKTNENEMNKQVFGLIVFNRFLPPTIGGNGSGNNSNLWATGTNTMTEFLSNQASIYLSDWLSKYDLSVNINYRSYEFDTESSEATTRNELELELAKKLGRVTINVGGNYDFGNTTSDVASANALAGDFSIEYDITEDGRVRVKAFQESEYDIFEQGYVNQSGVGIFFRKEFDSFKELFSNPKKKKQEAKEEADPSEEQNEKQSQEQSHQNDSQQSEKP